MLRHLTPQAADNRMQLIVQTVIKNKQNHLSSATKESTGQYTRLTVGHYVLPVRQIQCICPATKSTQLTVTKQSLL